MAISVVIGTSGSAEYLSKALESVEGFDEVLVCDKDNSDASALIRSAKNDWILLLYPNEIVPHKLHKYLEEFIKDPGDVHGLFIPRRNFLMDIELKNYYPDFQLRFFTRDGTIWNGDYTAIPSVAGLADRIPATRRDLALVRLPNSLACAMGQLEATVEKSPDTGSPVTFWKIMSATMATFISEYIGRGKFFYGASGYIDSVRRSMNKFYALARRHEDKAMARIWDKYKDEDRI